MSSAAVMQSCDIPDVKTPTASEAMGSFSAAARQEFRWGNPLDVGKLSPCSTDFRAHHCVLHRVGFTWQDFEELKDGFKVGFCGKTPEAASLSGTASFT